MKKHQLRERELLFVLIDQLKQNKNELLYALVDGTGENSTLYEFFRHAPDANYYPLFLGTEHENCLPHSPYLAHVESNHHEFIRCCTDTGHNIIWFTSPYTLEAQIDFWQSRLYCDLPDGGSILFRFWNGYILNRYLSSLNKEQIADFLPAVIQVFTPERKTQLWHHYIVQDQNSMPALHPDAWVIEQEHLIGFEDSFKRIQHRDIETELWERIPDTLGNIHPAFIPAEIDVGLQSANQMGLMSYEGQVRYIECQLRWGRFFWKDQLFKDIWNGSDVDRTFLGRLKSIQV